MCLCAKPSRDAERLTATELSYRARRVGRPGLALQNGFGESPPRGPPLDIIDTPEGTRGTRARTLAVAAFLETARGRDGSVGGSPCPCRGRPRRALPALRPGPAGRPAPGGRLRRVPRGGRTVALRERPGRGAARLHGAAVP